MIKNTKNKLKDFFFSAVKLPIFSFIYRKIYSIAIRNKLNDFKLSDMIVTIEPSNVCNSRCVMCPYPNMTRPKIVMTMELFKKIVNDCVQNGIGKFNLNFYNEPFLDPMIFERIKYLKSKNVRTQLFSNGSVLDDEKIDKIIESGLNDIRFSVDGAKKETYEKIRKGLSFEQTTANILKLIERKKELKSQSPCVAVVFVRSMDNEKEQEEFKKFWHGKADKVIISFDDNRNNTSNFFTKNRFGATYPCLRLWTEVVVMSDGKVALCCIDFDGSVVVGDFKNQNLQEIWNEERYNKIRNKHLKYKADEIPLCKKCTHPYRMNILSWWRRN
ncbi:MAG: radical SAM/SPASM domain-containing protein [bacterium]|nr:radical SAM/SPASM domain-containing protein [bacterium]